MDLKFITWTLLLLLGIAVWFYLNIHLTIDYKNYPHLIDPVTGAKRKPNEFINFSKIINLTKEYIEATDAQQRLYDLEYQLTMGNPFVLDQSYSRSQDLAVSGWPVADQKICGLQLDWILDKLNKHKNYTFLKGQLGYELTNLMDTFGKPEAGTYSGIVNWIGSYSRCTRLSLDQGKIKTRYCIARMRPQWWPKNEIIYPRTSIRVGICIPETCDTLSLSSYRSQLETMAKFDLPEPYKSGMDFESMFCLPDERSPIRQIPVSGKIFLFVIGCWIALVIVSSIIYECLFRRKKHDSSNILKSNQLHLSKTGDQPLLFGRSDAIHQNTVWGEILEALSLRCSMKSFKTKNFCVKYNQGHRVRVNLCAIDFFKVIMAILVVLGHSAYLTSIYTKSFGNKIDLSVGELGRLSMSMVRCVDIFFIIFGVLSSYTLMRKCSEKQISNPLFWLAINLGVMTRIAPVFMLVYWFSHSVSPYIGSGPWWDYGVDKFSLRGICINDSWWKSIPYFGSIGSPPVPACIPPAWFIVSYSQIALILPTLTYILIKLPNNAARMCLSGFVLLASTFIIGIRLYQQSSIKDEAFTLYGGFLIDLLEKFESIGYISTLGRIGTVSVGCYVGYLLRRYDNGEISKWPKWLYSRTTTIMTIISIITITLLPLIGHRISMATGRNVSLEEFVGSNMILMILFPILSSILILSCATVFNHLVTMRFCSHSFWLAFNRLGLCLFLVHWEVVLFGITNFDHGPSYGFVTDVIKLWLFGTSISIMLALLLHLFFEVPLSKLVSIIARPYLSNMNKTTIENVETSKPQHKGECV